MPYEQHPHCETPPDDAVLWRYMDFRKFMDLLDSKRLCLTRLDLLEDPREGRLTDAEYKEIADRTDGLADGLERFRNTQYVSCWQESAGESMAMWDLYGNIAIKSNIKALKAALAPFPHPAFISRIKYQDWKKDPQFSGNLIDLCVRKEEGYRHENEVRILVWSPLMEETRNRETARAEVTQLNFSAVVGKIACGLASLKPSYECSEKELGPIALEALIKHQQGEADAGRARVILLPVPTELLFSDVVVGPQEPSWVLDLIRRMMTKYSALQPVRQSDLVFSRR